MRSQTGSTAKTLLFLSVLIAGAIAMYLGMAQREAMEPAGGRGEDFVAHDGQLKGELQRLPSQKRFTIDSVEEAAPMTEVAATSSEASCDAMLLSQIYLTCTTHRTQMHRDGSCHVTLAYEGGQCAQP